MNQAGRAVRRRYAPGRAKARQVSGPSSLPASAIERLQAAQCKPFAVALLGTATTLEELIRLRILPGYSEN